MTLGAKSEEVLQAQPRTLARIQGHRRIERVEAHLPGFRDIKSGAGKAFKDVQEGDGAGVIKSVISKINFPIK